MNKDRYIRQILLDAIGEEGQIKLLNAHVVVIGCGGLGSIAAPYLAGAGVGKLTLIDGDVPHISNLHRQVFFHSDFHKLTKAEALAQHIQRLNSEIELEVIPTMISKSSIPSNLSNADVILECTDNIQVKYLINDYCVLHQIPMVYGAIHKYDGYVSFFENKNNESIHLRDVFEEPNDDIPSCSEVGVMGAIAGMIGLLQANEAIKFISGAGKNLSGTLLTYNILTNDQMKLKLKKTFTKDMGKLYERATYVREKVCQSFEISISSLFTDRDSYDLVSILEDHEHQAIDAAVERMPLSNFEVKDWPSTSEKTTVFYCASGVRSGKLVNTLLAQNPRAKVLSLAGGLKRFKTMQKP